jgi:hypothetical protein
LEKPRAQGGLDVVCLSHDEPTRFDAERLEELCLTLGEAEAEAAVADALKRIATMVEDFEWLTSVARPCLLKVCLGSMARDAELIGMITLARVAEAAIACLDSEDAVAQAAALARLRRIGERSILAVWDLDDAP